ncbi:vestitone reductase-like isoform X1 [Senna tora]|uniref:Vestitone reductase-like isoform X1 n=1 Tax=Senna tora TaxID=362788 RepID=A0A834WM63_9FABA|nr:vestitone reductase-like isoform X1 [Senna tora]
MENGKGRVCVTGGTGFIGSWMIKKLLEDGYSVNATVRSSSNPEHKKDVSFLTNLAGASQKLRIMKADLRNPESFKEAIEGCVGVFHVATPVDFEEREAEEVVTKRSIDGALGILKACLGVKSVKRVIYTSSACAVTLNGKEKEVMDESYWSDEEYLRSSKPRGWCYAISKTLTEKAVLEFGDKNGLEVVSVIPPLVVGPFISPNLPSSVRFSLSLPFGDKESLAFLLETPMVHVDDVARAHIFLLQHPNPKGRHNCAACLATIENMFEIVSARYPQFQLPSLDCLKEMKGPKSPDLSSKKLIHAGFKFENGLEEMFGCRYTWSNNREEGCVKEKIDRVLVNSKWLNIFPNAVATALPAIGSDHSPLVLSPNPVFIHRRKLFKVEDFWMENEEFSKLVEQHWRKDQSLDKWEQWSNRNLNIITDTITPLVSASMNDNLIKDVTMQEVENAVFGLGAMKAPGPDGINDDTMIMSRADIEEAYVIQQILNQFTEASGQIGSGENISVWFDRWLCSKEKIWPVGNAQQDLKVKDLFKEGTRNWDETKIIQLVGPNVARLIFATPIRESGSDMRVWPFTTDGNYSVKTGYHCSISDASSWEEGSSRLDAQDSKLWAFIWKAKVQPKIRSFIWRLCKNAIPLKENLARRKLNVDNQCPMCLKDSETSEHCFIYCDRARAIWFGSRFQWSNPNEANLPMLEWIENRISCLLENPDDAEKNCAYFFNLLWAMWKARNVFCFEGVLTDPISIIKSADIHTNEYLATHTSPLNSDCRDGGSNGNNERWEPPRPGIVKFNVDAALDSVKLRGALSTIARDHAGEVLTGYVKRFPCDSAMIAEARAVREAVQMCSALEINEAIIESDCKVVVDFCNNKYNQWQLETILDSTKAILKSNSGIKVVWIPRNKNLVADFLAKEALKDSLCTTWVWNHPVKLRALLLKDKFPRLTNLLILCLVQLLD